VEFSVFVLVKHYKEKDGWEIIELEDAYFIINSIEEMAKDYQQYYDEIFEYGCSIILNTYDS
jgi:hypothetical protein